jgi:hypothetical protein
MWCWSRGTAEPIAISAKSVIAAAGLLDGYFIPMTERGFGRKFYAGHRPALNSPRRWRAAYTRPVRYNVTRLPVAEILLYLGAAIFRAHTQAGGWCHEWEENVQAPVFRHSRIWSFVLSRRGAQAGQSRHHALSAIFKRPQ